MAVLIACAASTWFMAGVGWLVQVVQYPLFAVVGKEQFVDYHRGHSSRITPVVFPAMSVELVTAAWLLFSRPAGTSLGLVIAGFAAAVLVWAATAALAVPIHSRLAQGFDAEAHRSLLRASWVRTVGWSVHGLVVAVLLWQAAS